MTPGVARDPLNTLGTRVKGAARIAVVGIGDDLLPFDSLGMYAARKIQKQKLPGVRIFLSGTVPESVTGPVRRFHPDHVILLDSADLNARPGTITVLNMSSVRADLVSTHVMPLTALMEFMARDSAAGVTLLGIQPDLDSPDRDLSHEDRHFLNQNLDHLGQILRDR